MYSMAVTKDSLLQYFKTLDVSVLQRLQKYAQLLIIPDEDLLVNATMSQMVDKAHSLADALFPTWTDRSKSDFGEFLVELFALYSEKDFWYINALANESILRKMRSYGNAFSKASTMGYKVTLCKGSSADFSVTFSAGELVTYQRGDLVVKVNGLKFSNDTAFDVQQSSDATTLQLHLCEGSQVAEDISYNGYCIFLRKTNIDIESIAITIDNVAYTQVKNFGESGSDSTHFMVIPEDDGSCSIYFGSNGFGVSPAIGKTIRVEYRHCNGLDGNTALDNVEVNDSLSEREATSATMLNNAEGGTYAESLTSIKEKAPLYFNTKKAAINEASMMSILNGLPCVHKSFVEVEGRQAIYYIIPASGSIEPSEAEMKLISSEITPCLMLGYSAVYSANNYKSLISAANPLADKIVINAVISSGYTKASVEASIRQIMEDLTNPLVYANYGGTFSKTDADVKMRSAIPGLQSVAFKTRAGVFEEVMPDVTLAQNEIFIKITQNLIEVNIDVAQ